MLAAVGKPGVAVGQRGCAELLEAGLLGATAFLAASPLMPPSARPKSIAHAYELMSLVKHPQRH